MVFGLKTFSPQKYDQGVYIVSTQKPLNTPQTYLGMPNKFR
jgi:hypothetical protein